MMRQTSMGVMTSLALLLVAPLETPAQDLEGSVEQAAKKTQNPVADQYKLQLENFFNFGLGPKDATQYALHAIPTIPFQLSEDWNLITRTELLVIDQPSPSRDVESAFGLGDLNPTLYLSPRKHATFSWGLGPTFTFPTATESALGSQEWSAGPAAVALVTQGPWVIGSRINNQWSFAGWGDHGVNRMWVQPFAHYNFPEGWYLATLPTITANWKAKSGEEWTVPVGGGIGKHWLLGKLGIDAQLMGFYNVERPPGAANSTFLFQIQLVRPK